MRLTTSTIAALCLQAIASLALAQTPAADPAPAADPKPAAAEAADPRPRPAGTTDRLELEATTITGNRELPKVMYVVPWKRADIDEPGVRPPDSLLDEVLAPVDREVFSRENRYFRALEGGGNAGSETSVTAGKPAP